MSETILSVAHLHMRFGGIKALNDVNLDVARGSITALIGPNGAGKTTVFNCLTGFYRASGGQIMLNTRRRRINVIEVLGKRRRLTDGFHPTRLGRQLFLKCSAAPIWSIAPVWRAPSRISACSARCRW